jgi:predicted 3-demethylubiquinone-9 3-methyltransferase (glyoxalase superfamily)
MPSEIFPCIWMNNNAKEAVSFYSTVFNKVTITSENNFAIKATLENTNFLFLNGGNIYTPNSAVSYYYYANDLNATKASYHKFIDAGATIIMPFGAYPWSANYAFIIDHFGVSWQIEADSINNNQKIVPTLLFANDKKTWVKKAITYYTEIFTNATILLEASHAPNAPIKAGSLLFAQIKLNSFIINAMSSTMNHNYDFGPGNSFVITCTNQEEIDYYWDKLGQNGKYSQCGWLSDSLGISWQIVPHNLNELLQHPTNSTKSQIALRSMQKITIADLV